MRQALHTLSLRTRGKGLAEITGTVAEWVAGTGIETGLLTLFCRHTSASLLIQENADPDVRSDLESFFDGVAPENGDYVHDSEGPDDMPAHIRTALTGVVFTVLNAVLRRLALELHPFEVQFLRYAFSFGFMVPWILAAGLAAYRPNGLGGQLWRGAFHTSALLLWFWALPHVPLADATALAYMLPIFVMIGASWFLGERMRGDRWLAAIIAFAGIIIVLAPKLGGTGGVYNLIMLAAQPIFAGSLLITKALTRRDRPEVIVVWQALVIAGLTMPLAAMHWVWPSPAQWAWVVVAGGLGTCGQYCHARALRATDVSATQSVRFLELIWASVLGYIVFGDPPSQSTLIGGLVIIVATVWVAQRESKR